MTTVAFNRRSPKTGRPLGLLDVLSKVIDTASVAVHTRVAARHEARLTALRRHAADSAITDAAAVRRLADRHRHSNPGFASDLYAAADRHELITAS